MEKPGRGTASKEKLSVLIVEDDKFLYKILVAKFERDGFEVRGAADGENALEILETFRPSIILLDIILPKMNGFEVLSEIRRNAKIAEIPVIVLSNLSQEEDHKRASEMGAVDFVVKADISINDVVERVKEKYVQYISRKS